MFGFVGRRERLYAMLLLDVIREVRGSLGSISPLFARLRSATSHVLLIADAYEKDQELEQAIGRRKSCGVYGLCLAEVKMLPNPFESSLTTSEF